MPAAIPQYTGVDRVIGVVGYPKLERTGKLVSFHWPEYTGKYYQSR